MAIYMCVCYMANAWSMTPYLTWYLGSDITSRGYGNV